MKLLLLHGAIGSSSQLLPLKSEFEKQVEEVFVFDFPGHGGKEIPKEKFSMKLFAESVLEFLDQNKIEKIDFFGYSMGGYVALYLARHYPERVGRIFTLGTKLRWTEDIATKEVKLLDPEKISEKIPAFAKSLQERHSPEDWKMVLKKTAEMMIALGKNPELSDTDFKKVENKILLTLGDRDNMVTSEETMQVCTMLPNGSFEIIAETPHPIEQVDVKKLIEKSSDFYLI
jgi:pimeloyl-ACP methyl ester carboxylesterase